MTSSPYLSVVIPAFNEAQGLRVLIPALQAALLSALPGSFEIVVVDDGSTDETSLVAAHFDTRLLRLERRLGSGAARKAGSIAARGELCAWIDGDGTYKADDLVKLVLAAGTKAQVIGARNLDFGKLRWLRLAVKGFTSLAAGWLWDTRIPDLNSGLRVFRRTDLHVWLDKLPDGFSCTTTATLSALSCRQDVAFVAIDYLPRLHGTTSKFHPCWDTLRLWRTIFRCWRYKLGDR